MIVIPAFLSCTVRQTHDFDGDTRNRTLKKMVPGTLITCYFHVSEYPMMCIHTRMHACMPGTVQC